MPPIWVTGSQPVAPAQEYTQEYSIYVGDLAPETSSSDLVAVFLRPSLGLRNDREFKYIQPFLSCNSAKVMLDPVTGVSRGYGFVRFTDQADQLRALGEMQGLYCLSRPKLSSGIVRISTATEKVRAPQALPAMAHSDVHEIQFRQELAKQVDDPAPRKIVSDEAWKHYARASAILGNLIAKNGEQLTSTDPYNTTVFVGGLSSSTSEEILQSNFACFGNIHYVKVLPGKNCGFVQFVQKADAETAIEKMQGFPISGMKIRLSWGQSQ
ncbi:hypothetical protein H0H81_002760, partial [Sphagnurus paluster]